jgi:peptidoglycan/xylan/chitin deacetylase (PgdA/CDA1 family)/spore germination protein YaaH/drug/metabolite transporter superfamily protein YnfA
MSSLRARGQGRSIDNGEREPSSPLRTALLFSGVLGAAAIVVALSRADAVAGGVAACGLLAAWLLVRHQSPARPRLTLGGLVLGTTAVAVVAALAIPTYRRVPHPFVIARDTTAPAVDRGTSTQTNGRFEALGFVESDTEDSWDAIDRDARRLSTIAATGIALSPDPGGIDVKRSDTALVHAQLHGDHAVAVVTNYDGNDFNGARADAMIRSADARKRFAAAVADEVTRRGWDGVLLDLENLSPGDRAGYPLLLRELRHTLGRHILDVAVPAVPGNDVRGYDMGRIAAVADRVVWMAYDQHDNTGDPGPIAATPWVREGLTQAERWIPKSKLLLGVASYGYVWSGPGQGKALTVAAAQAIAAQPGANARWDTTAGEWHVTTADGRELWYPDARSFADRAKLAADEGLAGVALWRVGSEEVTTLDHLPAPVVKYPTRERGRRVTQVDATGVVALTFDDGPDPVWTPAVLRVLRQEHVPATFFVIGKSVQAHPDVLRQVVRDGHVIGNHTFSHRDLNHAPDWRAEAEILGTGAVIETTVGLKPVLYRSPYGGGDITTAGARATRLAISLGVRPVSWNNDSHDWRQPGTDAIVSTVLGAATQRAVVLLHDGGGDRSQTLAALPRIIHDLRARGYLFTTADALDASIRSPYADRSDVAAKARGVGIVAFIRLQLALHRDGMWLLNLIIAASLLRILLTGGFALGHWARRRSSRPMGRPGVALPSVTVIIPARNEERVIGKALAAINGLRIRPSQVMVVDDGSTDATVEQVRARGVTVVTQPHRGKAWALNRGLLDARGDVVVVLDADTILEPDFLDRVLPHFADPDVAAVAGNVKVGNRRRLLAKLQAVEYITSLNLDRRAQAALNVVSVVPGAAGAFRRAALVDIGGYPDETLVEDMDLTVTLLRAGWRVPYEPRAVAHTEAPEHVMDVIRQRRRWSFGTLQVVHKHRAAMFEPRSGRIGLIGLPWLLVAQILLPILGPVIDLYVLWMLLSGHLQDAGAMALGAVATDLLLIAMGLLMDGERKRFLLLAPLMRVLWRPLQLVAVMLSVQRWLHGTAESWRRVPRYNTVPAEALVLAGEGRPR